MKTGAVFPFCLVIKRMNRPVYAAVLYTIQYLANTVHSRWDINSLKKLFKAKGGENMLWLFGLGTLHIVLFHSRTVTEASSAIHIYYF